MSQLIKEDAVMPKGSPERTAARKEEIIRACEKLYQTMGFKEITLKEIGKETSFSRPTIYHYFQTREEIFLALYKLEYDRWNAELEEILEGNETLTRRQLADQIARSLEKREQLLKLLSMNNYDIEAHSRQELLSEFKAAYGESMRNIDRLLVKFCPEMSGPERQNFLYVFFPFLFGVYPYTTVSEKQRTAMSDAGVDFMYQSIYEITCNCLIRLLNA
jgi:AcrR family transcriptional regulator